MNNRIRMAITVAGVAAMLGMAGCGASTPDAVAIDFLKKVQSGKADKAYLEKNCTQDTAMMVSLGGSEFQKAMKGAKFTVVDTKINGDKAIVSIKQEGGVDGAGKTNNCNLVKVDGKWKVDAQKE